jgi:hypothetical protein
MSLLSRDVVLFANDAFYRAFADANLAAMDALWARNTPVTCIHPGWHPLNSREQIMDTWRQVFASDRQAQLTCHAPEAFLMGEVAFVICYEQLPHAMLIATNIFHLEQQQWRLVHHQSGPTRSRPLQPQDMQAPSLLAN